MLKAVCNDSGVVDPGFLVKILGWIVFAYDHSKVAGWVQKNLIPTYPNDGFQRNWFAMTG